MTFQLEQHIYSSTGRHRYETVGMSAGISPQVRRQLEAAASAYPDPRLWSAEGTGAAPPWLIRTFRLSEGAPVISFLAYVGQAFTRAGGNYVAHSFIVPPDALEAAGHNLPWIAAQLRAPIDWRPASGDRPDDLPPVSVILDDGLRFRLFAFVARELTATGLHSAMERVISYLTQPSPGHALSLALPAPSTDLKTLHTGILGLPEESTPAPDVLRLWRLAGLLTVLPGAFMHNADIRINEPRAPSLQSSAGCVLVVPRDISTTTTSVPRAWPWLDRCIDLAARDLATEWHALQENVHRLLPAGHRPSRKALDGTFALCEELALSTATVTGVRGLLDRMAALEGSDLDVAALHELALSRLAPSHAASDWFALHAALARLSAAAGRRLPPRVLSEVLACVRPSRDAESESRRRAFFRALPHSAQEQVWMRSHALRTPPGHPVADRGDVEFMLATFDPSVIESAEARGELMATLIAALVRVTSPSRHENPPSRPAGVLSTLVAFDTIDTGLAKELAPWLARQFADAVRKNGDRSRRHGSDPALGLSEIAPALVLDHLAASRGAGGRVLGFLTLAMTRYDPSTLAAVAYALPLAAPSGSPTAELLETLHRGADIADSYELAAIRELASVTATSHRCDPSEAPRDRLPQYARWVEKQHGVMSIWRGGEERDRVHDRLKRSLALMRGGGCLAAGASYLAINPTEHDGILEAVTDLVGRHASAIARWLADGPCPSSARARLLADVIAIGDRQGRHASERVEHCAATVLQSLNDRDRAHVIRELAYHLEFRRWGQRDIKHCLQRIERGYSRVADPRHDVWHTGGERR